MIAIGDNIRAERMMIYLNEHFPECRSMPTDELRSTTLRLLNQAVFFKLTRDQDVAPFLVGAWLMGEDFAFNFLTAREILENLDLDSPTKAERLWQFLRTTFDLLGGQLPTEAVST